MSYISINILFIYLLFIQLTFKPSFSRDEGQRRFSKTGSGSCVVALELLSCDSSLLLLTVALYLR